MTDRPNPTTALALKTEDLVLPCAAADLVNWLVYHTKDTAAQPLYATGQVQLTLYPAESVPVHDRAGYHKVQQLARYITYRKDGQLLQEGTAPAIDAEVVALGADRCEVHLASLLRGTDGYLDALVDEIRKRWLAKKAASGPYGGTLLRVLEARRYIMNGVPKTKACKRAHIDTDTYDRYVVEALDWADREKPAADLGEEDEI
jgi:hypothetical protein